MDNNQGKSAEQSFQEEYQRTVDAKAGGIKPDAAKESGAETTTPQISVDKKFKVGDRELTADQVFEEYGNLQKDYTLKTQELSELKSKPKDTAPVVPDNAEIAPSRGKLTPQQVALLAEIKELGIPTIDDVREEFTRQKPELIKDSATVTQSQIDFRRELDTVVGEWNGEDGKPKISKDEILNFYKENNYPKFSPDQVAKIIKQDDFIQYQARQMAGQGKSDLPKTEGNGAGVTTPPAPATYSFRDGSAERALREMLKTT